MVNILYIGDPNSIHDIKWMTFFSSQKEKYNCFLLTREVQYSFFFKKSDANSFLMEHGIVLVGFLHDFSIVNLFKTLKSVYLIKKLIIEKKIDLIHIFYANPNALWAVARGIFKVPLLITTRGTDILIDIPKFSGYSSLLKSVLFFLYNRAFRGADAVICTSARQVEFVKKLFNKENTYTIRTGVDVDSIFSFQSSNNFSYLVGKKIILFPRLMHPIYNHQFCLNSIALLDKEMKKSIVFIFIGKDGSDQLYSLEILKKLELMDGISYHFFNSLSVDEMFTLYTLSNLIVMTPFSDGTPNSALEAMLFRKRVILGPVAYDEDLFNKNTVYKLKSFDPIELKNLIELLISEQNDILINNAYEAVMNFGNRKIEMNKVQKVYRSLIGSNH